MMKAIKEHHLFDAEGHFKYKKDMLASIFDSWDNIIRVKSKFEPKLSIPKIRHIFSICDRQSKFTEGLYHNFLNYNYYDENMEKTIKVLTSLTDEDIIDKYIGVNQNYALFGDKYLPAAYFHTYLSSTEKVKNEYPTIYSDLYKGKRECNDAISTIREGRKEKFSKSNLDADMESGAAKPESFQSVKVLSRKQLMKDIIPYVYKLYRPANYIKNTILSEVQYLQLKEVLELIKTFPLDMVKKITFNDTMTRTERLGLNTFVSKSKFISINFRCRRNFGYIRANL